MLLDLSSHAAADWKILYECADVLTCNRQKKNGGGWKYKWSNGIQGGYYSVLHYLMPNQNKQNKYK